MKAFQFALDRVLSWRNAQLCMEEGALERTRGRLHAAEALLMEVARRESAAVEELAGMMPVLGSDVAEVAQVCAWAAREKRTLTARIAELHLQIASLCEAVTEARRK